MARQRSSKFRYSHHREEGMQFEEVDRLKSKHGYSILVYDVWSGDKDDPATEVERRAAMFNKVPANPYKYNPSDYYWEGLEDAVFDQLMEVVQEADEELLEFRHEQENTLRHTEGYRSHEHNTKADEYAEFLNAIDHVGEDENDEKAWEVIYSYREQKVLELEPTGRRGGY